jgi:hypothetical protein
MWRHKMKASKVVLFFMLTATLRTGGGAQQTEVPADMVLARASDYVSKYEADLGNLIGREEYVQSSVWMDASVPPRVSRRMQRRTSSDFLIIQVGSEWAALRKVNRVDGIKVKETAPAFDQAFDNSPEANAKLLDNFKRESTEYNLGDVRREMNLPTFALHVLRKNEITRFSFDRAGTAKIDGVQTWKIRFRETAGPTLVVGDKGQMLNSKGMLWIEPETGRVLQTEFEVENSYASPRVNADILVTYTAGKNVNVLVPVSMSEHYESAYNNVECRADYSNFRPFEVDVKFEIAEPK